MNLPLIPDKSHKFIVYIGIGLIIYSAYLLQKKAEEYDEIFKEYSIEVERFNNEVHAINAELNNIYVIADSLSNQLSIDNPLEINDSGYVFLKTLIGSRSEVSLSDSIDLLLSRFKAKDDELKNKKDEIEIKEFEYNLILDSYDSTDQFATILLVLGSVLLIFGLIFWVIQENAENELLKRQIIEKPSFSDNCQSCGKTFNSMVKYGIEKDGSKNYHFCESCYSNGQFSEADITLDGMKQKIREEMVVKNRDEKFIKKALHKLEKVERWTS